MPFPKKNTSVPVHLDLHSPVNIISSNNQQQQNNDDSPFNLNNSSILSSLNNTQTTPNLQQLGSVRSSYINQVG